MQNPVPLSHPAVFPQDVPCMEQELQKRLLPLRESGKIIVFTNGCFDLLHPGHVDLLERARAEGDFLVLGLNSDDSVKRLGKGPERPVNTFAVRAFVLAHLAAVDLVVEFNEDTPLELIRQVSPGVLVKGGDWAPEIIVGKDFVESAGGRVLSLPLLPGFSTTGLIGRLRG
jgi:cytidyltransferase-related domain